MTQAFSFGRFDNAGVDTVVGVGTVQVGAAPLTGAVNNVTTGAGQTAVGLPEKQAYGSPIIVVVSTATAGLVFPPAGGKINNGATNASFSVAQNKPTVFFCHPNGIDYTTILSA